MVATTAHPSSPRNRGCRHPRRRRQTRRRAEPFEASRKRCGSRAWEVGPVHHQIALRPVSRLTAFKTACSGRSDGIRQPGHRHRTAKPKQAGETGQKKRGRPPRGKAERESEPALGLPRLGIGLGWNPSRLVMKWQNPIGDGSHFSRRD